MTPVARAKAHAGQHLLPNGMTFKVYWIGADKAAWMNREAKATRYGHPARVYAGWYYDGPDGERHGPHTSSRRAWAHAKGLPDDWHARPRRNQPQEAPP